MGIRSTAESGHVNRAVVGGLAALALLLASSCGGGGGDGFVPATTTPFNAPLNTMNEPVTFNAIRSELRTICTTCDPESTLSPRSTNYQIKIDPIAQTVEIFEHGRSEVVFNNVDFTNGNTTFDISTNFISTATTESLKIVLPGASASNLDYASGLTPTLVSLD